MGLLEEGDERDVHTIVSDLERLLDIAGYLDPRAIESEFAEIISESRRQEGLDPVAKDVDPFMQEAVLDDEASALSGADVDEAEFPMQGSAMSAPWDEFLRSTGVVEVSIQCNNAYSLERIADNVPLGSVQYMGDSLTNQLAMCSRHEKCRMRIRAHIAGVDRTQLLRDMILIS